MAYASITFTTGEQPTTLKWNQIGENFSKIIDGTAISDSVIIARHLADNTITSRKLDITSGIAYCTADTGVAGAGGAWVDITGMISDVITVTGVNRKIDLIGGVSSGGGTGAQTNHIFRVMESVDGGAYAAVPFPSPGSVFGYPGLTALSGANVGGTPFSLTTSATAGHTYRYKVQASTSTGINYGTVFANFGSFLRWRVDHA